MVEHDQTRIAEKTRGNTRILGRDGVITLSTDDKGRVGNFGEIRRVILLDQRSKAAYGGFPACSLEIGGGTRNRLSAEVARSPILSHSGGGGKWPYVPGYFLQGATQHP